MNEIEIIDDILSVYNNNFKKEYIINIVNMWSKALLTFKNKTNELIKDSNTLKYNIL